MELYTRDGRAVMIVNNEYTNRRIAYGTNASKLPESEDDVRKGKASRGVSVFQVRPGASGWEVVLDAPENRHITADTPMDITGPARGHDLLKTEADPYGAVSLGTWNNFGAGPHALGHLSGLRRKLQRLFLFQQQRHGVARRLQTLRHQPQGLGLQLGYG